MELRVLGCYGGEIPGHRTTCFMINGRVLVDAGAVTAALPVKDQAEIDAIFLTHSHLDHVRDIGFMVDNTFGMREEPLLVYGLPETIEGVKKHVLNDQVWPDFSRLPTPEKPVMEYREMKEGEAVEIHGLEIRAVRVNHTVPAVGLIVNNESKSIVFSGDTGPTDRIWETAAGLDDLVAVFIETSFPDRFADLARASGHLTPASARIEIDKISAPDSRVYLYHMKPQYLKEIEKEIKDADYTFTVLQQGEQIEF